MYQEISDFMQAKQAEFDLESMAVVVGSGDVDEYDDGDAFALTPQFSALSITGDDAQAFLQGQFSSDVAGLGERDVQLTTYSNAKGRMQASLLLWRREGGFVAIIRTDLLERFVKRLSMFVMRSKVKITTLENARLAYWHQMAMTEEFVIVGDDNEYVDIALGGGLGVRCDFQCGKSLAALSGELKSSSWADLALIRRGIPWISAATFEAFVPQMANFDLLGAAISFKKGCYPGQEIVARTQYLGKVKRRLFRAFVEGVEVAAGNEIFASNVDGQSIGKVAMACKIKGGMEVLLVMQIAAWEAEPFIINSAGARAGIVQLPLPYNGVFE